MTARDTLITLIKRFEGLRLTAYQCPADIWTIGYGSTGHGVSPGVTWTLELAERRLVKDADDFLAISAKLCPGLSESASAAIADFAYNLGATRLAGSTLRRKINGGDKAGAANEIKRWVYGGGIKLGGLVVRRQIEAAMILA